MSTEGRCKLCDTELVWVERANMLASKKLIRSNFRTLGALQTVNGKQCYPICPRCGAYALGIELIEPYPIFTQTGLVTNVEKLNIWSEPKINKLREVLLAELKDCIERHQSSEDDVVWWQAENQALSSLFSYLRQYAVLKVNPDLLKAIDEDGFADHATEVAELLEQQADKLPEADRLLIVGLFKSLWSS